MKYYRNPDGVLVPVPDRRERRAYWRLSRRGYMADKSKPRQDRIDAWRAAWAPLRGDLLG